MTSPVLLKFFGLGVVNDLRHRGHVTLNTAAPR